MSSKEDPIVGISAKNMKNDILLFKEETLKDFKMAQKKANDNYKVLNLELKERLDSYEQRIKNYEAKILELSKLINTDKTIREKVDTLMEFKEKVDDSMLTEKIRLDNFSKDLNQNVDRIDKILKDSVIYPGIIGGAAKYKTFHNLIDYILTQCSLNLTFREKSILDFKGYKTKLENTISAFNTQVNTLLNTTSEYTKTCVKECEERMKSIYNIYDDRLQDARLENANYAIGLEKATEALKKELENLYVVKKELYEKVDNGILEVKNDNTRVVKLFSGYKKNFHVIQHKFTQLSEFIKDIRFRINIKNEEVKRREYSQMSDLINFDKKNKPGFYEGVYDHSLIKKKFGSQLKEYIEGKITADQIFKKKNDLSKSVSVNKDNKIRLERSKTRSFGVENNDKEDAKINFIDLLKGSFKAKMTPELKKTFTKKEIIKEEDDDINNSSKDINSVFSKNTVNEVSIDLFELDQKENKKEDKKEKKEDKKEDKKVEKNKNIEKKEKDNTIRHKSEDSKIQIISKEKGKEKDNKKNIEDNNSKQKERKSIKEVINDIFSVKDIMENIKKQNNESPLKEKNENQSEKKRNNGSIDNNKKIKIQENNKSNNNKNNSNKGNYNTLINEVKKNKIINKNLNRPATVMDIKNNEKFKVNQNNIAVLSNKDLKKEQKTLTRMLTNKKIENQDRQAKIVNYYNITMEPLNNFIQAINYKPITQKKPNSTNQKTKKYFLNQNTNNFGNSTSYKTQKILRNGEVKTIENMINNLNNYVPNYDINVDETNNFLGMRKKK